MRRIVPNPPPAHSRAPSRSSSSVIRPRPARIEGFALDAVQLQTMPFRARRVTVRLPRMTVVFHAAGVALRFTPAACAQARWRHALRIRSRGTPTVWRCGPACCWQAGKRAEVRLVVEAGWQSVNLLLPPSDLVKAHLRARQPWRGIRHKGLELLQVEPQSGCKRCSGWGHRLAQTAARWLVLFDARSGDHRRRRRVENAAAALRGADDLQPSHSDRRAGPRTGSLRRAGDFMRWPCG